METREFKLWLTPEQYKLFNDALLAEVEHRGGLTPPKVKKKKNEARRASSKYHQ